MGFANCQQHPINLTKSLLLLPLFGLALFSASCRTVAPLDPMTMKPSCKGLPENFRQDGSCCKSTTTTTTVYSTK